VADWGNGEQQASSQLNPWQRAQAQLRERLDEHSYKSWFSQTRFEGCDDGCLVVGVPSQFFADWLRDHYLDAIRDCVRDSIPDFKEVRFVPSLDDSSQSRAEEAEVTVATPKRSRARKTRTAPGGFNPRYIFNRFVVGSGNRFAHAAAKAVAEKPYKAYNPLFLYGGTGLGKTHLMQAIGQDVAQRAPQTNVAFISSEQFTNQLIESIAKKSTGRFRAKYRKIDVLLIDDIQFIAGKEATQEEFFHTFNTLFDNHAQIVLSSDCQPKDIPGLEERLVSRFEWGLVTDIQPPDLETRVAILQNKAQEENFTVPVDVLRYIATYITSNIRELEGALITVLAYSRLNGHEITIPMVDEVLRDLIGRDRIKPITSEGVQRAVSERFDLRISDLRGRSRQRQVSFPRQLAMYLCKDLIPAMSLGEIGEAFGGRDHTTVLHACKKVRKEVEDGQDTREVVSLLKKTIQSEAGARPV
jgi:chromosomal replication initiator protein